MFEFVMPQNIQGLTNAFSALSGGYSDKQGGGGFGGGGGGVRSSPSVSSELYLPDEVVSSTGSYLDDGSTTSAEKAADDNIGLFKQLFGSLTGENQRILQNLMSEASKAQYDYAERMSNSAYQRAVADLKKAGLNPAVMFSAGAGNAASTPTVGIAQVATENQLLSFLSSAGTLLSGLGSVLGAILGNVLPKNTISKIISEATNTNYNTSTNYNYNTKLK